MIDAPATKRRRLSPPQHNHHDPSPMTLNGAPQKASQDDFYARVAGWNLEQRYEQRPRNQKKKVKDSTRLPIKTATGEIEQFQPPHEEAEDEKNQDSWLDPSHVVLPEHIVQVNSEQVPKVSIRQQILEAKEELARVASLINEDPEEHPGAFRTLAQIASSSHPTIKKLGLATQLAVYKDVIPGYRIRPIAEVDQTEKVSKDVRRLRAFEQSLVGSYRGYLQELAKSAKLVTKDGDDDVASVVTVAISCACTLLLAVPHFNFRGELLKILIAKLSIRKRDAEFVQCRETMETFFHDDDDGTPSLDAVSLLTKMIKARNYQVDESVLNTFLYLRLLSEFSSKASRNRIDKPDDADTAGKKSKPQREFRTKKQRKILKERKAVEKEFKEADAIVSHEERDRMQSESLKLVFVMYFRILKAKVPNLMGAALEGLAKYSHLINQDFFGDILEVLKDLVNIAITTNDCDPEEEGDNDGVAPDKEAGRDATRESLLCIATAFTLLEGQDIAKSASSLNLDLTFFTTQLYRSLHIIALDPDLELSAKSLRLPDSHTQSVTDPKKAPKVNNRTMTVLLLRALTSILAPRTIPPVRLAAFTKQLYTCSLHFPEKSCLAMAGLLTSTMKTHGRKVEALWNTEERRGDGVFDPLREDLESSNPFASTIWEGELMKHHFVPAVREGFAGVAKAVEGVK